jgi:RNA polymerase sigma factor (sigma-70 family)
MHLDQPGPPSDALSTAEAPRWDESEFTALVERFEPLVLSICYRITGNRPDAEDAAQATFLALAQRLRARQRIDHLPAWVSGVARNCARHVLTAAARRAQHERHAAGHATRSHGAPEDVVDSDAQAYITLRLAAELRRLPPAQRRALELHYFEGQELGAISAMLGVASGTVASWLSRGRSRLRDRLRLTDADLTWALALGLWSRPTPPLATWRGCRHHTTLAAGMAGLGLVAIVASACFLAAPTAPSQSTRHGVRGPTASCDPLAGRVARAADPTPVALDIGYQMTLHLDQPRVGQRVVPGPTVAGDWPPPTSTGMTMPAGRPAGTAVSPSLAARIPIGVLRHPTLHLSSDPSAPSPTLACSGGLTISLPPAILAAMLRSNGGTVAVGSGPGTPSR